MEISEQNIMGTKPITPLLLGMSFPIMISMLVQALYNVVDSIFVARLSDAALTAVSFAYPVQMLTIAVSVGTSVGVNALLSRRLGEGNRAAAEKVAHNGILLMFVSWAVFAVFGLFGSGLFFSFFTDNPAIAVDGAAYLRTCLVFSLGMFLQICLERLIQVTGRTVFQMPAIGRGCQHRAGPHPHLRPAGRAPHGRAGGRRGHRAGADPGLHRVLCAEPQIQHRSAAALAQPEI